jgi:flagellar hook protein FlgE
MASTTALFTGLSGLTANARNLDVIGNNIANVNTTAYKSNRMLFANTFSRTFSLGSAPGADNGGTNPGQIGLGVSIAGTQRDFGGGALSATGNPNDLAIEGDGFFIVDRAGTPFYTRAGAFRQNAADQLVTISGERVRGFGVDSQFNIIPGVLTNLTIPVGSLSLAEATRTVNFAGNLNAGGALPTTGANIVFGALGLVTGPIGGPGGNKLELSSLLTQIEDPSAAGVPLFQAGQSILLTGAEKGSRVLPDARLAVSASSTVQDLITFLNQALGLSAAAGPNPNGQTPGVALNPATGVLTVVGNTGAANDLDIDAQDLRTLDTSGIAVRQPFTTSKTAAADGESVRTTFVVFDSLGTPLSVDLTMVLAAKTSAGTQWRYFVESADDTDVDLQLGTGQVAFDTSGQIIPPDSAQVTLNRAGTGAADPLRFTIDFASESDRVTALTDGPSQIAATFQDGSPLGTLATYAVGPDGIITGAFTNGLTRTVGQVALATFANPGGLVDVGSNLFTVGPNSGSPVVGAPQTLGAGRIVGGSLELSNVDLSQEFINMILASTGYSASARVITTTDQLMQQLLVLGR